MKYGFVYIWFDKKHKRYYIGAHWGTEDDGYICSSPWMKQAYTRRRNDFKRRILSRIYTNRKDMFFEESYWQSLIKDDELRTKYYNIKRHGDMHWSTDDEKRLTIGQKISKASKGVSRNKGKQRTESEKAHLKECAKQQYNENARRQVSENLKQLWNDPAYRENQSLKRKQPRPWMVGRKMSDETKAKMAEAARNRKKRCDK